VTTRLEGTTRYQWLLGFRLSPGFEVTTRQQWPPGINGHWRLRWPLEAESTTRRWWSLGLRWPLPGLGKHQASVATGVEVAAGVEVAVARVR